MFQPAVTRTWQGRARRARFRSGERASHRPTLALSPHQVAPRETRVASLIAPLPSLRRAPARPLRGRSPGPPPPPPPLPRALPDSGRRNVTAARLSSANGEIAAGHGRGPSGLSPPLPPPYDRARGGARFFRVSKASDPSPQAMLLGNSRHRSLLLLLTTSPYTSLLPWGGQTATCVSCLCDLGQVSLFSFVK